MSELPSQPAQLEYHGGLQTPQTELELVSSSPLKKQSISPSTTPSATRSPLIQHASADIPLQRTASPQPSPALPASKIPSPSRKLSSPRREVPVSLSLHPSPISARQRSASPSPQQDAKGKELSTGSTWPVRVLL